MKLLNIAFVAAAAATTVSAFAGPTVPRAIGSRTSSRHLFNKLFSSAANTSKYPVVADESVMNKKAHGTSEKPVMKNLRWKCDYETADRICVSDFSAESLYGFDVYRSCSLTHNILFFLILFSPYAEL